MVESRPWLSCDAQSHVRLQTWAGGCAKVFVCTLMSQWLLYVILCGWSHRRIFSQTMKPSWMHWQSVQCAACVGGCQVGTISSEFLADLRQLLLTPSNFLAGHCIVWRAISSVWAKGMHGCQGNKQWHVQACASSSLKIGGMGGKKPVWYSMKLLHAYCCSVPLGSVFASLMHALLLVHACPCIFMQNHACPCIPTCDHHACYMRDIFSCRQASLWTQGRSQCLWMRMRCPNGGSCSMSSQNLTCNRRLGSCDTLTQACFV